MAAVEFALIALPLLLVFLGTFEFGRALNVRNNVAYAADFAARAVLIDAAISDVDLADRIRARFTGGPADQLEILIGRETSGGIEYRTLNLRYPFTSVVPSVLDETLFINLSRRVPV